MKRNAKQTGSGGRLRLAMLLACAAAFLLVPASQAFAAPTLKLNLIGVNGGGGEVKSQAESFFPGTPELKCNLPEGGVQEGVCETTMDPFEGAWAVGMDKPIPGLESEFQKWVVHPPGIVVGGLCKSPGEGVQSCSVYTEEETATVEVDAYFEKIEPTLNVKIVGEEGAGGEVFSPGFSSEPFPGEPKLECNLPEGGVQEGVCENAMTVIEPGALWAVGMRASASPAPNSEFKEWKIVPGKGSLFPGFGCAEKASNPECIVVSESEDTEIEAIFACEEGKECPEAPKPSHTLTLEKEGTGEGWVTSTPAGINCGLPCTTPRSAEFEEGTVTLHAYGREFAGWAACPGTEGGTQNRDCEISLTEDKVAKATFTDKYALTVSKTGTGNGWVVSTPAGLNCGLACTTPRTAYFTEGTSVELYVYGSQFTGWTACPGTEGGTVNGKNRKCTIEMTADKVAEPNFTA